MTLRYVCGLCGELCKIDEMSVEDGSVCRTCEPVAQTLGLYQARVQLGARSSWTTNLLTGN